MYEHNFLAALVFGIVKNNFSALCPDKALAK